MYKKAQKLEDLGNGLRMIDFEQLRAEVQSLSDKIEGNFKYSFVIHTLFLIYILLYVYNTYMNTN